MSRRLAGALVFALAGVLLAILEPIGALPPLGHRVLMGLLIGMGLWIFQPGKLPFAVSTLLVLTVFLISGVDHKLVFAGFVSPAVWILLPATAFGYVLTKTGLGKRIALLVIKSVKPTYLNMTLAWLIVGLILSAFTPSIVIRIVIVIPIAVSCTETLGLKAGSKGSAFILLIAWAMAIIPGSGWLTGSLWGPIHMGMYGGVKDLEGVLTSANWLKAMALPMAVLTALLIGGLYLAFRPKALPEELTKEAFTKAYKELGPWSKEEIYSTVILMAAFVMFFTQQWHGFSVAAVCLTAFAAFYAVRVLVPADLATGISWNLILFIGGILGFAGVFGAEAVGISVWIKDILFPVLTPFGQNPWLFVMVVPLLMFAWRFVDIAWMIPTTALLISLLPAIHTEFGIHPLVVSCLLIMAGNFALLTYMQPFALIGSTLAGERSWTSNQLLRFGGVYLASCILTLAVSLLYWKATGFVTG